MPKPTVHVLFSITGAGVLLQALKLAGRTEQVVHLADDLSFGPINPTDARKRARWVEKELSESWSELTQLTKPFLKTSMSADVRPIVWLSKRNASNYAGFLWWLSHRGDKPCEIIDVTNVTVPAGPASNKKKRCRVVSLGTLNPPHMLSLVGAARPLKAPQRRNYQLMWQRLAAENAPLRVTDGKILKSVPITFFDSMILSCIPKHWEKLLYPVGEALSKQWDNDLHQTGSLVLTARVRALARAGAIEWRGDLSKQHKCEVRRVNSRAPSLRENWNTARGLGTVPSKSPHKQPKR